MLPPPDGLNDSEQLLWKAFPYGEQVDLRPQEAEGKRLASEGKPRPEVSAEVIAHRMRAETDPAPGKIKMLHLRGVHIIQPLDLQFSKIDCPMIFEDCSFDMPVNLSHATVSTVSFRGCNLDSLHMVGTTVQGDLDCVEINARRVDLFGARVEGQLWMNKAHLFNRNDDFALNAPNMVVVGGVHCRDGFRAEGGVNLYGANIGAGIEFVDATLSNPGGTALRGLHLTIGSDLSCSGRFQSVGTINLFSARIGGQLWMSKAHLTNSGGSWALSAPQITIVGGMYCRSFLAEGGINLWGARIGAGLEFTRGTLINPEATALHAPHLIVGADVDCVGIVVDGGIDFTRSIINGRVTFDEATLEATTQVNCTDARIGSISLCKLSTPPAMVNLGGAEIKEIHDDRACWPRQLNLGMLSYDFFQPYLPPKERLTLLKLDPDGYQPGPYEQLAAYYRRIGHDDEARTVLLAKERNRREKLRRPARIWSHTQDAVIGFGYKPARAFTWFVVLIAAMSLYFSIHHPVAIDAAKAPVFQPVAYSVDLLLPILDLGQEKAYSLYGTPRWFGWASILVGWILATTIIAGIMRVLSRK